MSEEKNKKSEVRGMKSEDENKEQHFPEDSHAPKQLQTINKKRNKRIKYEEFFLVWLLPAFNARPFG